MLIFKKAVDLLNYISVQKNNGATTGFVPTMGALHQGHISLIEKAKAENAVCVCSIFVNPTQFNDKEDLKKYPRTIEKDIALLTAAKTDVLFLPEEEEIYPPEPVLNPQSPFPGFNFGNLDKILEGKSRPGHFQGVAQVVKRLLEIVAPHVLYLGQKDYQQFLIVRKMMQHYFPDIQLTMCPIVREADGLAMSSRNIRLSGAERKEAAIISQTLMTIVQLEKEKKMTMEELKNWGKKNIQSFSSAKVDYVEICNAENLEPVTNRNEAEKIIVLAAVVFGKVRLIDNVIISFDKNKKRCPVFRDTFEENHNHITEPTKPSL